MAATGERAADSATRLIIAWRFGRRPFTSFFVLAPLGRVTLATGGLHPRLLAAADVPLLRRSRRPRPRPYQLALRSPTPEPSLLGPAGRATHASATRNPLLRGFSGPAAAAAAAAPTTVSRHVWGRLHVPGASSTRPSGRSGGGGRELGLLRPHHRASGLVELVPAVPALGGVADGRDSTIPRSSGPGVLRRGRGGVARCRCVGGVARRRRVGRRWGCWGGERQ